MTRYTLADYREDSWKDEIRQRNGEAEARSRWCVTIMANAGDIRPSHHGAAERLMGLIERGHGQGGSSGLREVVDGSGSGHISDSICDQGFAQKEANNAFASVHTRMSGAYAPRRRKVFDIVMSFPHLTIAAACQQAGMGYGRASERLARHLAPGLDLLVLYFDAIDADRAREKNRSAHA